MYIGGSSLLSQAVSVGTVYALIRYTAVVEQGYTALSEAVARFFASYGGQGGWAIWWLWAGGWACSRGAQRCRRWTRDFASYGGQRDLGLGAQGLGVGTLGLRAGAGQGGQSEI